MKKLLLITTLFFSCFNFAQNLTLNELISLRKMDVDEAETFLTNKGWKFIEATEPIEGRLGMLIFSYGSSTDINFAESFLNFYYTESDHENRINVQIVKQPKYLEYLGGIKKFDNKPITKVKDGNLQKIYVGATTVFEFTTTTVENRFGDTIQSWNLFIVGKMDYLTNFTNFSIQETEEE